VAQKRTVRRDGKKTPPTRSPLKAAGTKTAPRKPVGKKSPGGRGGHAKKRAMPSGQAKADPVRRLQNKLYPTYKEE
jgi:hypothetical protein